MLKNLFRKIIRKVTKNPVIAEVVAEKADKALVKELDKRTGGLASKVDRVV